MIKGFLPVCILVCASVSFSSVSGQADVGNGIVYEAPANADTFLHAGQNQNFRDFLIVSFHSGFPKKRILIKFNTSHVPTACQVVHAKMYIHFWYAHKASYQTVQQAPYLSRPLQVHQMKRQWSESVATSTYRLPRVRWSQPNAALGVDFSCYVEDTVTMVAIRPSGYVEFDVTNAMKKWLNGEPNYGLMIWDPTETIPGRDIRFYSHEHEKANYRPFMNVLCAPCAGIGCLSTGEGNSGGDSTRGDNTGGGGTGGDSTGGSGTGESSTGGGSTGGGKTGGGGTGRGSNGGGSTEGGGTGVLEG